MSYGSNRPWGLQARKTINGATWNGQVSPYLIASGYNKNIFRGDPVILNNAGFVISLWDWAQSGAGGGNGTGAGSAAPTASPFTYQNAAILGVFDGCGFITPTSVNPIDPASPGRSFWPASTVTLNAVPAIANIIDDANVIFDVQSTIAGTGFTQANMGLMVPFVFQAVSGTPTQVNGDFSTGVSLGYVDNTAASAYVASGTASNNSYNVRLIRISDYPGNVAGLPYNNAEVLIQRHAYALRAFPFA